MAPNRSNTAPERTRLTALGTDFVLAQRGGQLMSLMYHRPGQLVGYPLLDLDLGHGHEHVALSMQEYIWQLQRIPVTAPARGARGHAGTGGRLCVSNIGGTWGGNGMKRCLFPVRTSQAFGFPEFKTIEPEFDLRIERRSAVML